MLIPIFNNHAVEVISFGSLPFKSLVGTVVHHDDGTTEWVDDDNTGSRTVRVRLCDEHHGHFVTLLMDEIVLRERSGPEGMGWCCRTLLREVRFGDEIDDEDDES